MQNFIRSDDPFQNAASIAKAQERIRTAGIHIIGQSAASAADGEDMIDDPSSTPAHQQTELIINLGELDIGSAETAVLYRPPKSVRSWAATEPVSRPRSNNTISLLMIPLCFRNELSFRKSRRQAIALRTSGISRPQSFLEAESG